MPHDLVLFCVIVNHPTHRISGIGKPLSEITFIYKRPNTTRRCIAIIVFFPTVDKGIAVRCDRVHNRGGGGVGSTRPFRCIFNSTLSALEIINDGSRDLNWGC